MQRIIGCALDVHRGLGPGYHEAVYQDAMAIEMDDAGLSFSREVRVPLTYRGRPLRGHRLDFLVGSLVVVELKAVAHLDRVHVAQVAGYLKSSGLRAGLIFNFNAPQLKSGLRRIVR